MMTFFLILTLLTTTIVEPEPPEFKNIIVLLDLSDRIKPEKNPNQIKEDQQIINNLLERFEKRQKRFMYQKSKDKFSVVVAVQKDSDIDLNKYGAALSIDMGNPSNAERMNKPLYDQEKQAFTSALKELYEEAAESKTTGADIWSYFRDNLEYELEPPSEYQNYVIVLTDGYMELDIDIAKRRSSDTYMSEAKEINNLRGNANWEKIFEDGNYGLRPHQKDYGNLKALVLEIIPKESVVNTNELPIIKKYWGSWFEKMDIPYELYPSQNDVGRTSGFVESYIF